MKADTTDQELNKLQLLEQRISGEIQRAQDDLESFTKNDASFRRKDTVEVVKDIMNRIKEAGSELNRQPEDVREKLYYIIYNATILIFKACHQLRVSNFSREATHFLAFNVLCLDNNLILTTTKYIDWRVLNYVELARAYADIGAFKAANKVISYGITKVLYTKQIEEQDLPVPDGTKDTLIDALRVLRTQELKYELQSGALQPEAWRKKLEETFSNNKYHRSLAIVECLQTNEPFTTSVVTKESKAFKIISEALKQVIELIKPDTELVKQALVQVHEKKKREREKKDKLQNRDPDVDLDELLDRFKQMDAEMIADKDWKFASACVPIEIHVQIVKLAFECQLWNEFEALLDPALVRLKFRRYEVPFLATVDVLMSANKVANIPNGFEKLPRDLNQANLRIELKKLRASAKKGSGGDSSEPKKEDTKKAAQPPPAKGKDAKGGKGAAHEKEEEVKPPSEDEIQASEVELDSIKHVYVNMLLQRTKNPQNAIVGIDVMLADENLGPDLPDNHFAVAVPIRQHAGSYEKQGVIPYVVFRRTANSLIDEEDSLSIISDVCIVQGQDPHLRAPLGYTKIPVDLRQTPKELERVPNLDYVFVCYKTDKQLALAERDLLILRRLAELEKSYTAAQAEDSPKLDESRQFLNLTYNQELLVDLSSTIKEALLGPLGDYYLENRLDMLTEMSSLLWTKYLLPVLQKIDIYLEMRGQKEFFNEFVDSMDESVIRVRRDFVDAFDVIYRVFTRMEFVPDMIMYCKFSIYLAGLQEEVGEFRNAVQSLRSALGKVIEYREERMKRTLDNSAPENASTAMSITIDNKRIGDLESKMETIYSTWEEMILRKERDRKRRELGDGNLDDDEGEEEQNEVKQCKLELQDKGLNERQIDLDIWKRELKQKNCVDKMYYNETDQIIHSLHVDVLMCLYRCEIKLGKEMQVIKRQTQDLLKTQGIDLSKNAPGNLTKNLSKSLKSKMNISKGKTLANNKSALKNLQQTLQEAGKLPPQKPQILSYEKILEKENNQNPYQNCLLYMALAMAKTNNVEQKSLLLESFDFLKKAITSEETQSNLALDNTIYIRASSHYHEYFGKSADQVHPYALLAKPLYIKKTPVPMKPIIICKTSTSITLKTPFYKPLTEYKAYRNIAEVSLFGKPSGSGVAVSLNNMDYEGTGEKKAPGSVINITGLIPNEKYVFAAGGYNNEGICVNGIGETSNEILTVLPISLHQLCGYLAEISFKLGHFTIAKQAAEILCTHFIIQNEFEYAHLDTKVNPILAFRLDESYLSRISLIEAKQLAESFIILAKVTKIVRGEVQRRADHCELQVEKQKIDMKVANFLCIALEISTYLNRPSLTKRVVAELYNHLTPYFTMKMRPQILLQVLLKCHQSLRLVPEELVDQNCRRILGCLSYQVIKLGFETSEDKMLRRAMISELPINSRKWRRYAQYVVQKPQLSEEERQKFEEQQKRIELGEEIAEQDLIKEPEAYEERLYKLDEFENEGNALEEFMLSLMDFQDIVKAKTERWKDQVSLLSEQISDGEEITQNLKDTIAVKAEFWEQVKLNKPNAQLATLIKAQQDGTENHRFLEFCCKCIRRSLETGDFTSFKELGEQVSEGVKVNEEDEAAIETRINERIEYLNKDIVRKQRIRFAALESKVQQMLEQQTLNGGNATLGTKKLQQLVSGDKDVGDDDENQLIIAFDNKDIENKKTYAYLWISEKYFLQGMCMFLDIAQSTQQRSYLNVDYKNCVFNDILQIDFIKYKNTLEEHNEVARIAKQQFDDEHKEDEEEYTETLDQRIHRISDFLQTMARAAEYAKNSRSWLQLVSIIRYTWNVFSFDLINPLELTKVDGWRSVLLIAECSLYLIEHLQKGGSMRKIAGRGIDEVKNQKPTFEDTQNKTVAFQFEGQTEGVDTMLQTGDADASTTVANLNANGTKWFAQTEEFEIQMHASFIAYTVQCLMAVSKWESLVDISNRLNNATNNEFASYLLPFIIYAQSTLFESAAQKTTEKRKALETRIQQFENWKATSKKKRSRQAMLTGEIPPEEKEFLVDKQQLEKEIFRLDVIENVLLSDRQASDGLLENIKRDANNCVESLKQCRKLYHQFGIETQNLATEEKQKGETHFEIKSKRKGHKVFTSMVIGNYKKCIELARKRQEKFLLIQSLHELGNLQYADGNLGEAEICWNDCVDTIFQRLYVVNQFRSVFNDNAQLADAFGSKEVLIGGIVLTKLAKLCYEGMDLHKHSECILMAAELFAAPAKLSMPHPQVNIEYANYSFREFGNIDLFTDQLVIQPSELLHAISVTTQSLIDDSMFEKAIPIASLMEYVAKDITRSKILTTKARLYKAHSLLELGYINEALQIYKRIVNIKDLPDYGARVSEHLTKHDGHSFQFPSEEGYRNSLTPEADENQEAIKLFLEPISSDTESKLMKFCSPFILESLQFLRALFLVKIGGENENVEKNDKAELRQTINKTAEEAMRASLKRVQFAEEIAHLRAEHELSSIQQVGRNEEKIESILAQINDCFEKGGVQKELQETYYTNTEEELCYADSRSQRLCLILRIRSVLGRLYQGQGLLLESFYVLREGLTNFKKLAEGQFSQIEKGVESENKGSFKLPEMAGGAGNVAAAAKKGAPPPKDAKGKGGAVVDEADQAKQEGDGVPDHEAEMLKAIEEQKVRRQHPHIGLWLQTKISIISMLIAQKRYEDCEDAIAVTRLEAQSIKDQLYVRKLKEIEFQIHVQAGDIKQALLIARDIISHGDKNHQTDQSLCEFLGNLSELYYNQNKSSDSLKVISEARKLTWNRLRSYGLQVENQNINDHGDVKIWENRKRATEEDLDGKTGDPVAAGKAAPPKGGKAPAKGATQADIAVDETTETSSLDFSNPIEYKLNQADQQMNSSSCSPTIYLNGLESLIRFDLRHAQYLTMIEQNHQEALEILNNTEKLVSRCLYISPQLKFYQSFLLGHICRMIFYEKVLQFQAQYMSNPKYKESFVRHVPHGSIALGHFMIELPNFSDKLKNEFRSYLDQSEKAFLESIQIAQSEAVVFEFDFTVVDSLRGLSEICFLQSEYRCRILSYKYVDYNTQDLERRLQNLKDRKIQEAAEAVNDNLDDGLLKQELEEAGDKWEEGKEREEALTVFNYKNKSNKYLLAVVKTANCQSDFIDKQHELSQTNLTDPAKIPKEIVSELFEQSQVSKISTSKQPDYDFKDKSQITSSELLAYMKAIVNECCMLTFGAEKTRLSKLISKLHRVLVNILPTYQQRCQFVIPEITLETVAAEAEKKEIAPKGQINCHWMDFKGQKSCMFYILGPFDTEATKDRFPEPEEGEEVTQEQKEKKADENYENGLVHYGKVEVTDNDLSKLYQDTRDLIDKMKASEEHSAEQNERDRKGYSETYNTLILRLGNLFKPPIQSEEELEQDVDCFALVKELLPELSVSAVEQLALILQKEDGCHYDDALMNAIMRRFHRVRYLK